jgi:carboxyl-terminal processing protease
MQPGESPAIEVVGIGVALGVEPAGLHVDRVVDGSGAQVAGIVVGDVITAVDGVATSELGLDAAVARIRGVAGTTVAITLQRRTGSITLAVQRRPLKA